MFNPKTILKALPSFWREKFEDVDLLETLYSFLGVSMGDAYSESLSRLASMSLEFTPLTRNKTWCPLYLSDLTRLHIPSSGTNNTSSITVYGIAGEQQNLISCSRIYSMPDIQSAYLEKTIDYDLFYRDSAEIHDLGLLTGRSNFFRRFGRYLVVYNNDPLYFFNTQEPEDRLTSYPLTLRLLSGLLTEQGWSDLEDAEIELTYNGETVSSTVYTVIDDSGYKLVLLDPDTFDRAIDNSSVTITGITTQTIVTTVHENYLIPTRDIYLCGYNCSVDDLELSKRWGHLIKSGAYNDLHVRSTQQYKNILTVMLESRLRGLTVPRITRLANILANSSMTVFDGTVDAIVQINLVEGRVVTQLSSYELKNGAVLDNNISQSALTWNTASGVISRDQCSLILVDDTTLHRLIATLWSAGESNQFEITDSAGAVFGNVIAPISRSSLIVQRGVGWSDSYSGSLYIYYTTNSYIALAPSTYSLLDLAEPVVANNTVINPSIEVADYNTGIETWLNKGLVLPRAIWEEDSDARRLVSDNKYEFTVGSMPLHRVGDYRFVIPTDNRQGTYFDAITEDNPQGLAWLTAYKLTKDLLLNKIVVSSSLYLEAYPNDRLLNDLVVRTIDNSKLHIPLLSRDVVEYIPTPQDSLDIAIVAPDLIEIASTVSYGGIGSLGYTLLLSNPALTSQPAVVTVTDPVTSAALNTQVIGWESGYLLLDLGFFNFNLHNNAVLSCVVDGTPIVCNLVLATNFVGSASALMVVGASYPEYTAYYGFAPNTVGEWLQPELIN